MTEEKKNPEKMWKLLCHLTALSVFIGIPFGNVIGPLIIWLIKKDEFKSVDIEGKKSLNFQISMTIYILVASLLMFVIIGFILLPVILIGDLILVIIAMVKLNEGVEYNYPFTITFIK